MISVFWTGVGCLLFLVFAKVMITRALIKAMDADELAKETKLWDETEVWDD